MKVESARQYSRIIAMDVRPHWFGFAVFEAPTQLLDFGLTRIASPRSGELRFSWLIRCFRPRLVVLRRLSPRSRRKQPGTETLLRLLQHLSHRSSIEVERVSERQLRQYFSKHGASSKDEIACLLAGIFPHLYWKLPPRRKSWQHEHKNMPIFDGVALGIAHFAMQGQSYHHRQLSSA
jgi:hypothetical protein